MCRISICEQRSSQRAHDWWQKCWIARLRIGADTVSLQAGRLQAVKWKDILRDVTSSGMPSLKYVPFLWKHAASFCKVGGGRVLRNVAELPRHHAASRHSRRLYLCTQFSMPFEKAWSGFNWLRVATRTAASTHSHEWRAQTSWATASFCGKTHVHGLITTKASGQYLNHFECSHPVVY